MNQDPPPLVPRDPSSEPDDGIGVAPSRPDPQAVNPEMPAEWSTGGDPGSPDADDQPVQAAGPAESPLPLGGSQPGEATEPALDYLELLETVRSIEQEGRRFHTRAERYEDIILKMQTRIEQLQGDQVQALLRPVLQRFAGLQAQALEAAEGAFGRGEEAAKDFGFFAVAIEEALGLLDLESVGAAPSVGFDPGKHHASRITTTDDPALDSQIHRVLRQGFGYPGAARVLMPAQVSVYRYEPPAMQEPADLEPPHTPEPTDLESPPEQLTTSAEGAPGDH